MTTRFDEFVQNSGVAMSPVDRFAGLMVEVGVPAHWEPFNSALGVRVWVCRDDPCMTQFCANAVLTMHRIEAPLDASDVFAMLANQQMQSVLGCHELHRELAAPPWGTGVVGTLALRIVDELGAIDSLSQTRIITTAEETLIAQLTVTALHVSPVDRGGVWMKVRTAATADSASAGHHDGLPVAGKRHGR